MKLTITNRDIYNKVCELERHVIKTNGKVILNRWISGTALTLIIMVIGALVI